MTLTEALARRDVLGLLHAALKAVADATAQQQARYSRSEIRMVRTFDVAAVRARVDQLARERRQLDVEIQNANWTVDLQTHGPGATVGSRTGGGERPGAATARKLHSRETGLLVARGSARGFDSRVRTDTPSIVTPAPGTANPARPRR